MNGAEKVRAGLYVLKGVRCSCGGEVRIERCGHGELLWEPFCTSCKTCDPDGWPSLKVAIEETPEFWRETKGET